MAEESKSRKSASPARKSAAKKPAPKKAAARPAGSAKKTAATKSGGAQKRAAASSTAKKPTKRAPAKKASTAKKPAAAKSATARKPAAGASAAKKARAKKASAKKAPAKKAPAKKAPAKKASAAKASPTTRSRPPVNLQPLAAPASAGGPEEQAEEADTSPARAEANGSGAEAVTAQGGDPSNAGEDGGDTVDISDTVAPSIGPHTTMPKRRPTQHHDEEHSKDAMGLDKRRSVVGGRYSASLAKQLTIYGVALTIVAALVVGAILVVGELDKPPETYEEAAPWTNTDEPPPPLQ